MKIPLLWLISISGLWAQDAFEYTCYLTRPPKMAVPEITMDCTIDGAPAGTVSTRVLLTLAAADLVKAGDTIDKIKRMVADLITAFTSEDLSDEAHLRRKIPGAPPPPPPASTPPSPPIQPPAPAPAPPPPSSTPLIQADCTDPGARQFCQVTPNCVCTKGSK